MDRRDLLNVMRHAYLLGGNNPLPDDDITWSEERDEYLSLLIDEYEETRCMDYGDDPGSCPCEEKMCSNVD